MAVEDAGPEEEAADGDGAEAQDGVADGVIPEVAAGAAVDAVARVESGAVDEVVGDAVELEREDAGGERVRAAAEGELGPDFGGLGGKLEIEVVGEDDGDLLADFAEGGGEGAEHVGEAAGLAQGRDFGGDHQHAAHVRSISLLTASRTPLMKAMLSSEEKWRASSRASSMAMAGGVPSSVIS